MADSQSLALAYEQAARAYTVALAQAGGGTVVQQPDYTLTLFPQHHSINGVISPNFSAETLDARLEEILALARQKRASMRFKLGPSTQPDELPRRLKARGLKQTATTRYMGCELTAFRTPFASLEGLSIYPVIDFEAFLAWPHPFYGGRPTPRKRALAAAFQSLAQQQPRRHWLFAADYLGHFAASGVIFFHEDIVVGYDFAVVKALRRRKLGAALLQQMAVFAAGQGAHLAVLNSSHEGLRFYPHFGFLPAGNFQTYQFVP